MTEAEGDIADPREELELLREDLDDERRSARRWANVAGACILALAFLVPMHFDQNNTIHQQELAAKQAREESVANARSLFANLRAVCDLVLRLDGGTDRFEETLATDCKPVYNPDPPPIDDPAFNP